MCFLVPFNPLVKCSLLICCDARPNLGRLACGQIKMLIMLSLAAPSSRYKILNILIREFSRTVDVKLLENTLSFDKFEKYKTVFSKSREVPEKFREQALF